VFAICAVVFCACTSVRNGGVRNTYTNTSKALKDYAFCRCLMYGFEKDSLQLTDASIGVLYELSDYSITPAESKKLDSVAKSVISTLEPLQPADYGGKKAIILKCIEFYKSRNLKTLTDK